MATTYNNANSTVSPGYGAVPSLTVGHVPTSGQFLTSAASNGTGYTNVWSTGTTTNPLDAALTITQTNPPNLEVKGKMVLNGRDLEERLDTIEKVLAIPERDVKLEAKHPKLKKLYDEYIAALGKYRTFESIKGDND